MRLIVAISFFFVLVLFERTYSIALEGNDCVICTQQVPQCPATCPMNQECTIIGQTCTQCSRAVCQNSSTDPPKEEQCLACSKIYRPCPKCRKGHICVRHPQTCNKCETVTCEPDVSQPDHGACVNCLAECPPDYCKGGLVCVVVGANCNSCGRAVCRAPKSEY
ncbi:hypothetical protein G9A89_007412 [Geosiphon pyriformis]|nr:hypothetical protein G9A89_007412 [Geosiphon pyriformis]